MRWEDWAEVVVAGTLGAFIIWCMLSILYYSVTGELP